MCNKWNEYRTLSRGNRFYWGWSDEDELLIKRELEEGIVGRFTRDEYDAMLGRVNSNGSNGTPLGSAPDRNVPENSVGALITNMRGGEDSVRPLCAHLVAVAECNGLLTHQDRGRGPGRGLWLFPVGGV